VWVVLGIIALLLGAGGLATLTQATEGVGLIGLACLFGILARISQADAHRQQDKKAARAAQVEAQAPDGAKWAAPTRREAIEPRRNVERLVAHPARAPVSRPVSDRFDTPRQRSATSTCGARSARFSGRLLLPKQ
jgi:hypothetical protein